MRQEINKKQKQLQEALNKQKRTHKIEKIKVRINNDLRKVVGNEFEFYFYDSDEYHEWVWKLAESIYERDYFTFKENIDGRIEQLKSLSEELLKEVEFLKKFLEKEQKYTDE